MMMFNNNNNNNDDTNNQPRRLPIYDIYQKEDIMPKEELFANKNRFARELHLLGTTVLLDDSAPLPTFEELSKGCYKFDDATEREHEKWWNGCRDFNRTVAAIRQEHARAIKKNAELNAELVARAMNDDDRKKLYAQMETRVSLPFGVQTTIAPSTYCLTEMIQVKKNENENNNNNIKQEDAAENNNNQQQQDDEDNDYADVVNQNDQPTTQDDVDPNKKVWKWKSNRPSNLLRISFAIFKSQGHDCAVDNKLTEDFIKAVGKFVETPINIMKCIVDMCLEPLTCQQVVCPVILTSRLGDMAAVERARELLKEYALVSNFNEYGWNMYQFIFRWKQQNKVVDRKWVPDRSDLSPALYNRYAREFEEAYDRKHHPQQPAVADMMRSPDAAERGAAAAQQQEQQYERRIVHRKHVQEKFELTVWKNGEKFVFYGHFASHRHSVFIQEDEKQEEQVAVKQEEQVANGKGKKSSNKKTNQQQLMMMMGNNNEDDEDDAVSSIDSKNCSSQGSSFLAEDEEYEDYDPEDYDDDESVATDAAH